MSVAELLTIERILPMKKILTKKLSFLAILFLTITLFCSTTVHLSADSSESAYVQDPITFSDEKQIDSVKMITVPFLGSDDQPIYWEFPYSDQFFSMPKEEFSITMARGSMGLTVSAFRDPEESLGLQYMTYLSEAGFTNIFAFGYDKPTSKDSLSGVIGMKQIDDFIVIAAVACGSGYGNEWASNMWMGNETRHEGFETAAKQLENYLEQYIEDNNIEGKKKLWLSGFSRASAVANITAADMIESGEYEDVYGYFFGVPRTTKEPVKYEGIYNICGQNDPVPCVPLQTWGYERYGTDIYTPSQETDPDYGKYLDSLTEIGNQLDGKGFRNNPEINYQLRLIIECFGELLPNSEDYCERLQDIMQDVIIHHESDHLLEVLPEVLDRLKSENAQDKVRIDTLMDYIVYVIGRHMRADQSQIIEGGWDEDAAMVENVALEHLPPIYIRWLFADFPPEEIFTTGIVSRRITIIGNVNVTVEKDGKEIGRINRSGQVNYPERTDSESQPWVPKVIMTRNANETIITLPGNEEYYVKLDTDQDSTVSMYGLLISPKSPTPETDKINMYRMSEGIYGFLVTPGKGIDPNLDEIKGNCMIFTSSNFDYSSVTVMSDELEATRFSFLSLQNAYYLVRNIIVGHLVFLILCLIVNLYHRHKIKQGHPPYSIWYDIAPYLFTINGLNMLTLIVTYNLFAIDIIRIVCASLTMLTIACMSLHGTLRYKRRGSILLTAVLFGLVSVTFLFFNRASTNFSWFKAGIYLLAIFGLCTLAVRTFRNEDGKITNEKPNTETPAVDAG